LKIFYKKYITKITMILYHF